MRAQWTRDPSPRGSSLAALLAVAFLAGCGGGTPAPDDSTALPARTPMTATERVAAIGAVTSTLATILPASPWEQRDLVAEIRLAADELVTLPEVAAVLVSEFDQSATVVLSDGFPLLLVNNRPPRPGPAARVLARSLRPAGLPGNPKAVAASYGGGEEVAEELKDRLGDARYDVLTLGPSLDDMRRYTDLGFLYLDTHSGSYGRVERRLDDAGKVVGYRFARDATGGPLPLLYVFETSTRVDADALTALDAELLRHEVLVSMSQDWLGNWTAQFGVSELFIDKHWSFDEGVVIAHSCYGGAQPFDAGTTCFGTCPAGTPTLDPEPLRLAILAKGANALMTFDHGTFPPQASPSLYYFIDRLLGANVERPTTPPGRPFDWRKVQDGMIAGGLDSFVLNGNTVNILLEGSSDPVALRPSLRALDVVDDVDASAATLTLRGQFGHEAGTVSLGGAALAVTSWSDDAIVARLPYPTASHGEVRVSTPTQLESNAAPITHWEGSVSLTKITSATLVQSAGVRVHFRGDIHAARMLVDGQPRPRKTTAYVSMPGVTGATLGSGVHVSDAGTETRYEGGEAMVVYGRETVDALVGGVRPTPPQSGVSEFAGLVELDPDQHEARLCLWLEGYHDRYRDGELRPEADGYFSLSTSFFLSDSNRGLLDCFHMVLEDDGSIPDGERTYTSGDTSIEFEWKDFRVDSAPGPGTPG